MGYKDVTALDMDCQYFEVTDARSEQMLSTAFDILFSEILARISPVKVDNSTLQLGTTRNII